MNLMPKIFLEYWENHKKSTIYKILIKDKRFAVYDNYQSPFIVWAKSNISHLHFDLLDWEHLVKPTIYFWWVFSEIRRIKMNNQKVRSAFYIANIFDVINELREQNTIHLIDIDMYKWRQNEIYIKDFIENLKLKTIVFKKDISSWFYKIIFSSWFLESEIKLFNSIISKCKTRIQLTYEFIKNFSEKAWYKYKYRDWKVLVFDWVDKCWKSTIWEAFLEKNKDFKFVKNLKPIRKERNSYAIFDNSREFSFYALYAVYNLISRSWSNYLLDRWLLTESIYSRIFRNWTKTDLKKHYMMDRTFSKIRKNITHIIFIPVIKSTIQRCKLSKETWWADLWLNDKMIASKVWLICKEFKIFSSNSKIKTIVLDQNWYNKIKLYNFNKKTATLIYKKFKELWIAYLKEKDFELYKDKVSELLTYYITL